MDHLELTLNELRSDRDALDELITRLTAYAGLKAEPPAGFRALDLAAQPHPSAKVRVISAKPKATPKPQSSKVAASRSESAQRVIAIVKGLKEPFTTSQISEALGNPKQAGNFVQRWKAKGWLTPGPTLGTYQRGKAFGESVTDQGRALLSQIHKEINTEQPE
jgi:hypothetical protein